MKKILIFLLIFTLVFSSFTSFAADGDIIHTGLKRIYRVGTSDITNDLMNDVMNNISNLGFLGQYYREKTIDGVLKYINVVDEETSHLSYLSSLVVNPADLENYIKDNLVTVAAGLEAKTVETAKTFGDIVDLNKGKIEDYTGSSDARRLKSPENYSTPVQGLGDNTTRIMKLTRPSGISATKWVYLLINLPVHLKPNDIVDGETYVEKADIPVSEDKYILLCATDRDNKVKAYTNILVLADMINKPRVPVDADLSIEANFAKSINKSGATVISSPPEGNWRIAVLPTSVNMVYEDSKFANSVAYINSMEFVVANDAEVDSMAADFNKDIIIYSEKDKMVDKYRIFNLNTNEISGALDAKNALVFTPSKGLISGNTVVAELDLPLNATKFMYALVGDSLIKPKLDRVFVSSVDYVIGNDIAVGSHKYLMLLATDDGGKVKSYGVVELLSTMIQDPLADELKELTNYSMPDKGNVVGTTGFQFLNYDGANLYYELSTNPIVTPEKDSALPSNAKPIVSKDAVEIFVGTDPKLRDEKRFTMYMNLYAVIDGKVVASTWQNFPITPDNVRLPEAEKLPWSNYKDLHSAEALKPGSSSDSTILKKLNKDGILNAVNLNYVYKFVDAETFVGINEVVKNTKSLEAGKELLQAKVGRWLLVLLIDSSNRTKYYTNIELTNDNTRTSDAKRLVLGTNYSSPEAGTVFESTKFNLLGFTGIEDATQFMVKTSDAPFKAVELNSKVAGAAPYAHVVDGIVNYISSPGKTDASGNILSVDIKDNRYLLLISTDNDGNVKGYINLTLNENSIRGKKAPPLTPTNFTLGKGVKPGTVKFNRLSPFGLNNLGWIYKWSPTDVFTANPPFTNQIITDAFPIRTKALDQYSSEGVDDIKVGDVDHGYILLLAVNGNKAVGYTVILVKSEDVQSTADILDIQLSPGTNPDSTLIGGTDIAKAKKYIISTTEMEKPGPNSDLPRTGVKDLLTSKEVSVKIGEYLRIFNVDENNKVIGFRDFTIESSNIQQGTALLRILNPDGGVGSLEILEGKIRANAIKIQVELTGAKWTDVVNDATIKGLLLDGLEANGNEQGEWSKVIQKIKDGRFSISKLGETLTITTTATGDYNISVEQKINLTIPPKAIIGAINPIIARGEIVVKPTIDAKISGSIVNNIRQTAINSGNTHIIIDIVDSPWIDTIDAVANKALLLDGFSGGGKWAELKSKIGMENIKLIDPQRISITIPKNEITINNPETITLTIDESLVEKAESDIIAAPSFTIYPNILPVKVGDIGSTVVLEAPKYVNALAGEDIWIIDLDGTSFKEDFAVAKDISHSALPGGLKLEITKVTNKQLSIKLTGKSTQEINNGFINLVIKSSAIEEKNYSDSNPIQLTYKQGNKIHLDDVLYEIKDDGIYLVIDSDKDKLQYSTNSTTGANGTWDMIPVNDMVSMVLQPITIYVREAKQPGNFKLVGKLVNPPAPTGIAIDHYDYSGGLKVRLNESTDLQYNLGTPNTWVNVDSEIALTKNSVLIVRKKGLPGIGEDGYLPSLATPKLNGLYLGEVELDVTDSKMVGATTAMQYKLSSDGAWNSISINNPVVDFKSGNDVWISDVKNEINAKPLGIVSQAVFLFGEEAKVKTILDGKDDLDGIYYHIGDKRLINNTDIELQFNITKGEVPAGPWASLAIDATIDNIEFIPGNIFVRKIESSNSLPSNPVKIFEIAEPVDPPKIEINESDKTLLYEDLDGSYKILDDDFEYKINTGEYQNGSFLETDPKRLGTVLVYVKRKVTQRLLASKESNFKFIENISLTNVRVNVVEKIIDGTTTQMEYKTDVNNPWKTASGTKTSINMYEGMSIWIRESGKPSTEKLLLEDLGKMNPPIAANLEYNIARKYIKNNSGSILEYRINDGDWNTINLGQSKDIEFVPSRLSIRTKATVDKLPSSIVTVIEDLDFPDLAPEVDFDDSDNKVVSIGGFISSSSWEIYEFKLKTDSEWIPGNKLKTYDLSGNKVVQIRAKAKEDKLSSEIREITFTKNIDLTKVELRNTSPIKFIYTETEMEYQVYLWNKPVPTTWTKATAGTTLLDSSIKLSDVILIVIRDSRTKDGDRALHGEIDDLPLNSTSLAGVTVDIDHPRLMNTTEFMEYSLNSTGGKDGSWTKASNNNTQVQLKLGTVIWIRDMLNVSNFREIGPIGQEPIPSLDGVFYNIATTKIANFSDQNLEYRVSGGSWKPIVEVLGASLVDSNVEFKAGPLEFRRAANGSNAGSKPVTLVVIKAASSKPVVAYDDIEDKILSIDGLDDWKDYEYKLTAGNIATTWTPGNLLKGEILTGNIILEIRKTAKQFDLASQTREITFTVNEIKQVRLSTNIKPFELNGTTTQMQYRINGADWKDCTEGNTPLMKMDGTGLDDMSIVTKIEVREKQNHSNIIQLHP